MSNIGHFEPVAKLLADKRDRRDYSTCDIKILLKNERFDMVHSMIAATHSRTIQMLVEDQRTCVDLANLDEKSVRMVIDWMYTDSIDISINNLEKILEVVGVLKMDEFQKLLEDHMINLASQKLKAVPVLNIATSSAFSVTDQTLQSIISKMSSCFDPTEKLTFNSVQTIMTSKMTTEGKVGFVNMVMRWMNSKKARLNTRQILIQSLYIDGVDQDGLAEIRQTLAEDSSKVLMFDKATGSVQFEKPSLADQFRKLRPLSLSQPKRMEFQLHVANVTSTTTKPSRSQVSMILKIEDPFRQAPIIHRTQSELENIQSMPNPFERPEIQKYSKLSQSQISMLEKVENPFKNSPVQIREIGSEAEDADSMPDPFQKQPACFLLAIKKRGNSNSEKELRSKCPSSNKSSIEEKTAKSNFDSVCLY